MQHDLILYSYWRSSAAYRVRIALNLLGLDYHLHPVHLVRDGGLQHSKEYSALNPMELVPTLLDGERRFTQSMAIMEYLDERYAEPPQLLPADPRERARVRALAQAVGCDIHPLGNLRVLKYLDKPLGVDEAARKTWSRHWIEVGFKGVEAMLAGHPDTGEFCHSDQPGLADACLVPQVYNANRWGVDMTPYPSIARIHANCTDLHAFQHASPEQQADAPAP